MYDLLDEQLIRLLEENARQSSESLATRLHVSSTTVRRRLRRLRQSGILHTVVLADPRKIGFHLRAILSININSGCLDQVVQTMVGWPEIEWLLTVTGRFDIVVLARFHSSEELSHFLQRKLTNTQGIQRSETMICLEMCKEPYLHI